MADDAAKQLKEIDNKRANLEKEIASRQKAAADAKIKQAEKRTLSALETKNIKVIFDKFDADKSGFIDKTELKNMVTQLGCAMTDDELAAALAALDANADNKISFDEFVAWWTTDKKLGGNSGVRLAAMRTKLLAELALADIQAQRIVPIAKLSESVNQAKMSARTAAAFDPKVSANVTMLPLTKDVFDSTVKEWSPPKEGDEENPLNMAFNFNFNLKPTSVLADVQTGIDKCLAFIAEMTQGDESFNREIRFKVTLLEATRVANIKVFMYMRRNPVEETVQQLCRVYGIEDNKDFNSEVLFDLLSFSFESGIDLTNVMENYATDQTRLGAFFDNFAFNYNVKTRKDSVEYFIIQLLKTAAHRGIDRILQPGPEWAAMFAGFMAGTLNNDVVVGNFTESMRKVSGSLADRFRVKFLARVEKAIEEKRPPFFDDSDEDAKKLVAFVKSDALEKNFEAQFLQRSFKGNRHIGLLIDEIMRQLCQRGCTEAGFPHPLFIPLLGANISELASVQVMTPYFGLKVDLKGVNPFASLPASVEALEKKSNATYEEKAKDALDVFLDEDLLTKAQELLNSI